MPTYFIAEIDVQDAAAFEDYRQQVPATIARYGGRYLVRGGAVETLEGDWQPARMVVLEFPSRERAQAFYDSPEYAPLKALRLRSTRSRLLLLEGVSPPAQAYPMRGESAGGLNLPPTGRTAGLI